jgi:alanyl-tRNA synthetase
MGVERTIAILNGFRDNYLTEIWQPIIKQIEKLSGKKYKGNEKSMRIIADHLKASVFIIADGIIPSNTQQGYVLRRLIRRAIKYGKDIGITNISKIAESVFRIYDDYPELGKNREKILKEFGKEEERFRTTIEKGMSRFNKLISRKKKLSGKDAFLLYQSYGFPIELTEEMARERKIKIDKRGFDKESEKHQKLSRTATKGVFGSGLADHTEKTIRLHTATHLLNEALRKVLDKNIKQKGSNITPERLRFDFNFDRKLTEKEIKKVENLVNKKISEKIKVTSEEMPLKKALKIAQAEFGARYPDTVSVYSIGNFSTEICTGPHVKNTRDIGKFRIIKEESSAAGVRRIKAVVE